MTVAAEHWWTIAQVAAVFEVPPVAIELAITAGWLATAPGPDGSTRCDPISVEGLRRRLARVARQDDELDPREAERVRLCLENGARERQRALADGHSYSTYPTIPPPPLGWDLAKDESLNFFVRRFLVRSPAVAAPEEADAGFPPIDDTGPVHHDRHPEQLPGPSDDEADD